VAGDGTKVRGLAFLPGGGALVSVFESGGVARVDLGTGARTDLGRLAGDGRAAAVGPDGRLALASTAREAVVRDPATSTDLVLAGHRDAVASCAWIPGRDLVATAGYDGTVRLLTS
jgi:WD40 repeat protein